MLSVEGSCRGPGRKGELRSLLNLSISSAVYVKQTALAKHVLPPALKAAYKY